MRLNLSDVPHRVQIARYLHDGSRGRVFAEPETARCYRRASAVAVMGEGGRSDEAGDAGVTFTSKVTLGFLPHVLVSKGDRIIDVTGETLTVAMVTEHVLGRRVVCREAVAS